MKKPKKDVAACENFFELVVEAHIVAAAMLMFEMSSIDDHPCTALFPQGSERMSKQQRKSILLSAVKKVVTDLVDVSYPKASKKDSDHVYAYARKVLFLGLPFWSLEMPSGKVTACVF